MSLDSPSPTPLANPAQQSVSTAATAHHLRLNGLSHSFGGQQVLRGIDLQVQAGEVLCLAGPSGCGKSTLLRLIAGLEQLQTGSIHLDDELIASPARQTTPEQRDIGLVFQDFALFPHLSLLDNVAFGLHRLPKAARAPQALAMLERVGLAARAQALPHELSGGQQQRVALARALAPQPRLLLLDEPFSNLDVRLRHRLRAETLHLLKASGTTSIMVTHDPDEAMFMADRIALLQGGQLVQIGTPEQIYHHPVSPFAAEFFGDINRLRLPVQGGQLHTPLGQIAAPALPEGSLASLLIRPEALQLATTPGSHSCAARLLESHMLGATSWASIVIDTPTQPWELQVQLPSQQLSRLTHADALWVSLDAQGAFVFGDDEPVQG